MHRKLLCFKSARVSQYKNKFIFEINTGRIVGPTKINGRGEKVFKIRTKLLQWAPQKQLENVARPPT